MPAEVERSLRNVMLLLFNVLIFYSNIIDCVRIAILHYLSPLDSLTWANKQLLGLPSAASRHATIEGSSFDWANDGFLPRDVRSNNLAYSFQNPLSDKVEGSAEEPVSTTTKSPAQLQAEYDEKCEKRVRCTYYLYEVSIAYFNTKNNETMLIF